MTDDDVRLAAELLEEARSACGDQRCQACGFRLTAAAGCTTHNLAILLCQSCGRLQFWRRGPVELTPNEFRLLMRMYGPILEPLQRKVRAACWQWHATRPPDPPPGCCCTPASPASVSISWDATSPRMASGDFGERALRVVACIALGWACGQALQAVAAGLWGG